MQVDGKMGTVLLENPAGSPVSQSVQELQRHIGVMFNCRKQLSTASDKKELLKDGTSVIALHGKMLYLI